jgi:DinB superfamily
LTKLQTTATIEVPMRFRSGSSLFLVAMLIMMSSTKLFAADAVSKMYEDQVRLVENDVLSLARAMPADKYDFAPANGTFAGVRTFAEQIRHLATMIYMTAAIVLQEKSPYGPGKNDNGPDSVHSKAEVIEYLQASFAYARKAMASLTVANHLDPVTTVFGPMPRSAVAAGVAYHSFNHYGQMVVYARMNGVVPPTSQPTPSK